MKIEKLNYSQLDKEMKQTLVGEEVKNGTCMYYRIYDKSNYKDFWIFTDENNRLMIKIVKPDIMENSKIMDFIFNTLKKDFKYITLHIPVHLIKSNNLATKYGFRYEKFYEAITAKQEIVKINIYRKDLRFS